MTKVADLRVWEEAEIERSHSEATHTPPERLRLNEADARRYLDPPADTPFHLEYAFYLLGDVAGRTVLDFGCGNGENSVLLARRKARVIGLDVSASLLQLARRRLALSGMPGGAEFIASSAHDVALPAESVDVVFGIAILHHLDLALVAREVWRVLKPGGRAIFSEPVRNSKLLKTIRGLIPYQAPDVSPFERPLTDGELREFAKGFRNYRERAFSLPFINLANVLPVGRAIFPLIRLDGAILRRAPSLKPWAGVRVFEVTK